MAKYLIYVREVVRYRVEVEADSLREVAERYNEIRDEGEFDSLKSCYEVSERDMGHVMLVSGPDSQKEVTRRVVQEAERIQDACPFCDGEGNNEDEGMVGLCGRCGGSGELSANDLFKQQAAAQQAGGAS